MFSAFAETVAGMTLFNYPLDVSLFIISGIFYFLCALYIWKPFRRERNELIGALFAFLIYQAFAMVFMGIEIYTHNMFYGRVASLAVFIGSVYMLKFPFSLLSETKRRITFTLSMIVVLLLFVWFIGTPEREKGLMMFTIWYDVVVNGLIVGFFMFRAAFTTHFAWFRMKAAGGAVGVTSCCVVANVAMVNGSMLVSSVFQFLAPVVIVGAIIAGRKMQSDKN